MCNFIILPTTTIIKTDIPTSINSIISSDEATLTTTTIFTTQIPISSDMPTSFGSVNASPSDLPTISTTAFLSKASPSLNIEIGSDQPTSTASNMTTSFLPTVPTIATIPTATIPTGSDIPTFLPTITLVPTTLRGIPEFSDLPTPLSPIAVGSPSDLPTIVMTTILPSILDQPTHLPSSLSTAIKTDPTDIPSTVTPTIMPTISQECYICYNNPNANITNEQRIIDVRFLNFQGIYDVTCRQLMRLGLNRMIPPNTCVENNNDNNTIQDECGCTAAVSSTIDTSDRRTKSAKMATYRHNISRGDEIDATVDVSSWSLSFPRITEIASKEITATNIMKESFRPSNNNNDYKGEFNAEQTQKKQKLQKSLFTKREYI